jgi:2'-5' RNA ligase
MTALPDKPIRAFTAIRPDQKAQLELIRVQNHLKQKLTDSKLRIRWVDPETFHITLQFFGQIEPEALEDALKQLSEAMASVPSAGCRLKPVGLFKRSGAIWVGLELPDALEEQVCRLEEQRTGEVARFHAHFTLGRVKYGRAGRDVFDILEQAEVQPIEFAVDEVELVQSELATGGARHAVLCTIPLAG